MGCSPWGLKEWDATERLISNQEWKRSAPGPMPATRWQRSPWLLESPRRGTVGGRWEPRGAPRYPEFIRKTPTLLPGVLQGA